MTAASNPSDKISLVITLATIALVFSGFLILSLKTGKTLRGRAKKDESPFADRKLVPVYYWRVVTLHALICAFLFGCAIWLMIYGR